MLIVLHVAGTHMTWGINFGLDNATNARNMASSVLRAFSSAAVQAAGVVLDLFEIGASSSQIVLPRGSEGLNGL